MNKKMREILTKINEKKELAKTYMEGEEKDIEKASAILDEIESLEKEYKVEERIYNMEKNDNAPDEAEIKSKKEVNVKKAFGADVKKFVNKALDLETGATGVSAVVPEEISTEIERLIELEEDLSNEIEWRDKKTKSGKDRVKLRSSYQGFGSIEEGGKIPKTGAPQFGTIDWNITKYGGYIPATNEMLDDSDEDIAQDMIDWLSSECRITRSKLVKAIIDKRPQVDLKNLDGIKKTVTVTLGSTFKNISKIITNDDGLNYLDTLKDTNGRPLLNPNPTDSAKLQLRCGSTVINITTYSNETLPTVNNKMPFIIGSLKEGIRGYKRKGLSLLSSNTATVGTGDDALNAFEEDLTLIRGITRLDTELRDEKAFVNGYITIDSESTEHKQEDNSQNDGKQETTDPEI